MSQDDHVSGTPERGVTTRGVPGRVPEDIVLLSSSSRSTGDATYIVRLAESQESTSWLSIVSWFMSLYDLTFGKGINFQALNLLAFEEVEGG